MEDADEGTDNVVGIAIPTQIAAVDRALDQGEKCAVNQAARAFDEANGAARDGVHGGKNELFLGYMVDKKKHPGSKSFKRRHRSGEALPGCRELFDFASVNGFDQGVAGGKVPIKRAWADVRTAGNVVERSLGSVLGKCVPGDLKDALAVPLRIRPWLARSRRWRELLFRHT